MTTHTSLERINRDLQRAGIRARLPGEGDVQRLPALRGAYALIVNLAQEVHVDRRAMRNAPYPPAGMFMRVPRAAQAASARDWPAISEKKNASTGILTSLPAPVVRKFGHAPCLKVMNVIW
jgi:hypothetical protein